MMRAFVFGVLVPVALLAPQPIAAQDPTVDRLLDFGSEVLRQMDDPAPSRPPPRYRRGDPAWQHDRQGSAPARQPSHADPSSPAAHYTRAEIREVQRTLNALGYPAGPVDGLYGEKTARGIRAFERANGMPVTGQPDDALIAALRRARSGAAASAGAASGAASPERAGRAAGEPRPSAAAPGQAREGGREGGRDGSGRHLAYVALRNAAEVAVVDLGSGAVVERIPVGPLPRGTTASGDGSTVAVVNDGNISVSLIDTGTNEVVETLDYRALMHRARRDAAASGTAGEGGHGEEHGGEHREDDYTLQIGNVALAPDGDRVYIGGSWFGAMSYDRASGDVTLLGDAHGGPQKIGPTDGVLKISSDGSKLFVPDFGHEGLSIIDTDRMALIGTVPGLHSAHFDVSADGRFVADFSDGIRIGDLDTFAVRRLTEDDLYEEPWPDMKLAPVEISPDGNRLYALLSVDPDGVGGQSEHVYRIVAHDLTNGARLARVTVSKEPPSGMALSPDGSRIAIPTPTTNTLRVYDTRGLEELRAITVAPTPVAYADFIVPAGGAGDAGPEARVAKATGASDDRAARHDDRALVETAQRRLNALGYDAGPADGEFDRQTRRAILEFEFDQDVEATGKVSRALLARLEAAAGEARESAGAGTAGQEAGSAQPGAVPPGEIRARARAFAGAETSLSLDPDDVSVEVVELNGRPPHEAFVYIENYNYCGSAGCQAYVLDLSGPEPARIGNFLGTELDVLPGRTGNWRDIALDGTRQVYRDGAYGRP